MSNSPVEPSYAEPAHIEPTHVGPIAGGNLRASDADRDIVTTVLTTAYAEGRITRDEHDERLEQVLAARTFDELIPITSDLVLTPAPTTYAAPPPATTDSHFTIDTANANPEPDTMVGIFGGTTRKGKWRIRKETQAYALFGGIDLDLREATFEAPVVEISGAWCLRRPRHQGAGGHRGPRPDRRYLRRHRHLASRRPQARRSRAGDQGHQPVRRRRVKGPKPEKQKRPKHGY